MPFCIKCGKEYAFNAAFCSGCGKQIGIPSDPHMQAAEQHIKSAANAAAAAAKEIAKVPNIGIKVAAGLGITSVLIFFFPWVSALFFKLSGFDIVTHPRDFGAYSLFVALIPICASVCPVVYYQFTQGKLDLKNTMSIMVGCGSAAFVIHLLVYLIVSNKLGGLNVWTGWFYIAMLINAGIAAGAIFDKKHAGDTQK
jgi:hypothetical protein